MIYTVIRHPLVRWDLSGILLRLADFSGPRSARAIIRRTEAGIQALASLPHIGYRRHTPSGREFRVKAVNLAVIAFTIDDDRRQVFIVCVSYGGMDWTSRVRGRLEE